MELQNSDQPPTPTTPPGEKPRPPIRRIAGGIGVAVVAVIVAVAIISFIRNGSSSHFDVVSVAELAPGDTHFLMALNTDLTSDPWLAVPRLLDSLGIEEATRADLRDSAEEAGYDYDKDFVPGIAAIRRAGLAIQYVSAERVDTVAFIDSRDPESAVDLFFLGTEDGVRTAVHDDASGLDFEVFEARSDLADSFAITTRDGIVLGGGTIEAVVSFLDRSDTQPTLAESLAFQDAVKDLSDDALVVGYGSGRILEHPDFSDALDALADASDMHPRDAAMAFALTARSSGWGGHMVLSLGSGLGSLGGALTEPADVSGVARLTPDNALLLAVGSGLGTSIRDGYEELVLSTPELIEFYLAPFEGMFGVSFERDVLPLVGNTFGLSIGFKDNDFWVRAVVESAEATTLSNNVQTGVSGAEAECGCDIGIVANATEGFAVVQWPDLAPDGAVLADDPDYQAVAAMLPSSPSVFWFLNLAALPEEVWDSYVDEVDASTDGYDFDVAAIRGIGLATSGTDTSVSVDIVVLIRPSE